MAGIVGGLHISLRVIGWKLQAPFGRSSLKPKLRNLPDYLRVGCSKHPPWPSCNLSQFSELVNLLSTCRYMHASFAEWCRKKIYTVVQCLFLPLLSLTLSVCIMHRLFLFIVLDQRQCERQVSVKWFNPKLIDTQAYSHNIQMHTTHPTEETSHKNSSLVWTWSIYNIWLLLLHSCQDPLQDTWAAAHHACV